MFVFILLAGLLLIYPDANDSAAPGNLPAQPVNHPPQVKIQSPLPGSEFSPGSEIHYTVTVADPEDGDSRYDEINPKQVLLEVTYFKDSTLLKNAASAAVPPDPPGLILLRTSNCFNCHAFEQKLTGPSFRDIFLRYPPTPENKKKLEKSIAEGSSGKWGKISMPNHPELSADQLRQLVAWLAANSSGEGHFYTTGLQGSFPVPGINRSGGYLLTASYRDHGSKPDSLNPLRGQHRIQIRIR